MSLKIKNIKQVKLATVTRSNTTIKAVGTLPASAQIVGVSVFGKTASDAATTATVKLSSRVSDGSAAAQDLTAAIDVKGANGLQILSGASNLAVANVLYLPNASSKPQHLLVTYAETGGASTTGGPWYFIIDYI